MTKYAKKRAGADRTCHCVIEFFLVSRPIMHRVSVARSVTEKCRDASAAYIGSVEAPSRYVSCRCSNANRPPGVQTQATVASV